MLPLSPLQQAQVRLKPYIHRTPLYANTTLSRRFNTNVYLKLELFQKTGSFKPRAAFNKMLQLSAEERQRGVVAVSGGNFAQGVAYASQVLGVNAIIVMPNTTPQNYLDATRGYGAQVELVPSIKEAFAKADEYKAHGRIFLHPYDDPDIMAGDGTIGLEIVEDVPQITDVIISVGGGGLMSGIISAIKQLKPQARAWTVETEGANSLALALAQNQIVHIQPTSLSKTLGAPYASTTALAIAQQQVAQHILVSDAEAYHAECFLMERAKLLPELAAAATLAALEKLQSNFIPQSHVVLVLCGGNVSVNDLALYKSKFG